MSQLHSAVSKSSFAPYNGSIIHEHNHRYTPHLHNTDCDRFLSGVDKNRQARFYFTKYQTPCRVYLSYNDKLLGDPNEITMEKEKLSQVNPTLNGRKLSAKTLKTQLKLSPQFIEDAKNFIFVKDTMSLIPPLPQLPQIVTTNVTLTMAEMAVIPLTLPSLTSSNVSNTKTKNPHLQINKQPNKANHKATLSSSSFGSEFT